MSQDHIRNFAIIAHIDHGKSTLADRLLEITGTVAMRDMSEQLLDSNPIERERGITIKLAPVRMKYRVESQKSTVESSVQETVKNNILSSDFRLPTSDYILNLIDTPGHVDFAYEVSRSLAACEGAILVVDATQGIQAQTLANLTQARAHNLTIIPVINKIDLPNARIEETEKELLELGFTKEEMLYISAKTGKNVDLVLKAIVERVPPPKGNPNAPTRALVFSSQFDPHKGVVVFIRVVDGAIHTKNGAVDPIQFLATQTTVNSIELGYFMPKMEVSTNLNTGEVGYIATGLKDIRVARVGDTLTVVGSQKSEVSYQKSENPDNRQPASPAGGPTTDNLQPLPGYKEPKPMVFLGLFPISAEEFQDARVAMEKLQLSDSAFTFRPISSLALGNGFHCGFLGLLHAEIVQERILREFGLTLLATSPSVEYLIKLKDGVSPGKWGLSQSSVFSPQFSDTSSSVSQLTGQLKTDKPETENGQQKTDNQSETFYSIQSATELPDVTVVEEIREPVMNLTVFTPKKYVGAVMGLCQEKRGEYVDLSYFGGNEAVGIAQLAKFTYLMPLSEMIVDFFDRLKSVTEGYASLDYEFFDYQAVDVVKVDILVNKEKVDAFSMLVVRDQAVYRSREVVERLANVIPRQQFEIPIQGAIGGQVIARSDVKSFRKDVIQKLYGGDRTRKDKLLDKQKKGKAKMKLIGKVEIPQSAFFAVLKKE
jgi:GTP-binding protein LepA